jgi:IPT/TIG domain
MRSTDGDCYGTTDPYGQNDSPEVSRLSTGFGPFITTIPSLRGIGAKVLILGQGLTGGTSVTFNGVAAEFTVNSDPEITATIPGGAKTGLLKVTTPRGTLSTKMSFVIP